MRTDVAVFPLTSGAVSGSSGAAEVHVPWVVAAERLGDGPRASAVTLEADGEAVLARTEVRGLPVGVTMRPELAGSGELLLTPVTLSVGGREMPVELARAAAGRDTDLLDPRVLALDGPGVPSGVKIEAVAVGEEGLDLAVSLPPSALFRRGDAGDTCPTGA
ncbi:hypothetical protein [Jannaschia sp. R86511]|uniref:hypothetical protein n=1 Tax=Jannaschia sp. R86511 TaxID=3093853 RepID=UPI0036D2DD36